MLIKIKRIASGSYLFAYPSIVVFSKSETKSTQYLIDKIQFSKTVYKKNRKFPGFLLALFQIESSTKPSIGGEK